MKRGSRGHKLLTKELEKKLPALYETDGKPDEERKVPVKFFCPYNGWKWFALEYDPEQRLFFGLVKGFDTELGYFSLDELEGAYRGPLPLVERDCWWDSDTTLAQVRKDEVS